MTRPSRAALALAVASTVAFFGAYVAVLFTTVGSEDPTRIASAMLLGSFATAGGFYAGGLRHVRVSRSFGESGPIPRLLQLVVVLVVGQAVLMFLPGVAPAIMPILHFTASLLPGLAVLAFVGWLVGGVPWAAVTRGLAAGGCLAPAAALLLEGVVGLFIGVGLMLSLGDRAEQVLRDVQAALSSAETLDVSGLVDLLATPQVVLAILAMLAVAAPVIEELLKLAAANFQHPASRYGAWCAGLAAGAGFGLTESLSEGAMMVEAWPLGVLLRATATLMHATATGVAALGWHVAVREGRRLPGFALVLAAIGVHAAWNAFAVTALLGGLFSQQGGPVWLPVVTQVAILGRIALFALVLFAFRTLSRSLVAARGAQASGES